MRPAYWGPRTIRRRSPTPWPGWRRTRALRHTMGQRAAAKAKRDFDQRRVIALTLAVYEELLERKVRRGTRRPITWKTAESTV